MGYIESYKYDIFISYSHIDNEKLLGQTIGWIEEFYKDLTVALWQSIGTKDVKIWWDDRRLDGGVLFDDAIEEGIKNSAVLICLNSNAYLRSTYCKKELELFSDCIQSQPVGAKVGNHARILNALLYNIPYKNWHKELNGTTGFVFHDAEESEVKGHPLDLKSAQFRTRLQELTDCIVSLLDEFPKGEKIVEPPKKFTIFFADVADSLRSVRKRTISELEKGDYTIIYDVPPPYEEDEHEKEVKEKIEEADLTVHLLDQYTGREIEGEETSWYPQKQAELCLQSDKNQLIWIPADMDINEIEEDRYKVFMQGLESGEKVNKKFDYIRGTKSELPKQITDLAEQIKLKQKRQAPAGKLSVLLDTHYNDQLYALELSKSLLENNIQPYINPQEDDPRKNINLLEDRISQVNNVVFFYGKVTGEWVSERMKAARQFIVSNDYPIDEFYIYMLPPHKDPNEQVLKQRFIKVNVLNNSDMPQLDTLTLHQFVKNIKAYHE